MIAGHGVCCFPSCPLATLLSAFTSQVSSKTHPSAYSPSIGITMKLIFPVCPEMEQKSRPQVYFLFTMIRSDENGSMRNQLQEMCCSCWWSSAPSEVVGRKSARSSDCMRRAMWGWDTETQIVQTIVGGFGCSYLWSHTHWLLNCVFIYPLRVDFLLAGTKSFMTTKLSL